MKLKRKQANFPDWQRVTRSRYAQMRLDTPAYHGAVCLFCIDAVTAPLERSFFGRPVCLADAGYAWLMHFPADEPHCTVTTHFDARGEVVQWYIDLCSQRGETDDHIPWADDLYLDLVVTPQRDVMVKDAGELLDACESGAIRPEQVDLAWSVARRLIERIAQGRLALLDLAPQHYRSLLALAR